MENDPSINSQTQDTRVTPSNTAEAQPLQPTSDLKEDHHEIGARAQEHTDTGDRSGSPEEPALEKPPLDKAELESSPSSQDTELGHHPHSEHAGGDALDLDPNFSQSDLGGRADAHLESSSAASPEGAGDRGEADEHLESSSAAPTEGAGDRGEAGQELLAEDSTDGQSLGHSNTGPGNQDSLRRRLPVPGEETVWTAVVTLLVMPQECGGSHSQQWDAGQVPSPLD